jgi:TM2 domain-containing membrane protein YozV
MSEPQEYKLRWRGRETGPYALPEICRKLDDHEIGMGHEILRQGAWITLDEFFALPLEPAPPPAAPPTSNPRAVTNLSSPTAPVPEPAPREKPSPRRIKMPVSRPAEPPQSRADGRAPGIRPRRRLVFAFLGVFLGFLGAHNYYSRQWLTGLLQLLLSIATFLMGFGIIASWAWAMVEAVVVRKDGDGVDMI